MTGVMSAVQVTWRCSRSVWLSVSPFYPSRKFLCSSYHYFIPGRSVPFRGERGNDEPAIEMIKVSHLK